jgi:hypothetical protein
LNKIDKEREDLEALLPWHAAGTLNRRDTERVEKALGGDRELALGFDLAREELYETILLNETLGAPSARAMEKLFAAIDAEPERKPKVAFDLAGRLTAFVSSFSPRTLALAGSIATLAIVVQAGFIATDWIRQGTGAQVAMNQDEADRPEMASANVSDGTLAVIRFASNTTAADITEFLMTNKATVVGGPRSGGIYTIRLAETGQAKNDLIMRLQDQSTIVDFIATVQ